MLVPVFVLVAVSTFATSSGVANADPQADVFFDLTDPNPCNANALAGPNFASAGAPTCDTSTAAPSVSGPGTNLVIIGNSCVVTVDANCLSLAAGAASTTDPAGFATAIVNSNVFGCVDLAGVDCRSAAAGAASSEDIGSATALPTSTIINCAAICTSTAGAEAEAGDCTLEGTFGAANTCWAISTAISTIDCGDANCTSVAFADTRAEDCIFGADCVANVTSNTFVNCDNGADCSVLAAGDADVEGCSLGAGCAGTSTFTAAITSPDIANQTFGPGCVDAGTTCSATAVGSSDVFNCTAEATCLSNSFGNALIDTCTTGATCDASTLTVTASGFCAGSGTSCVANGGDLDQFVQAQVLDCTDGAVCTAESEAFAFAGFCADIAATTNCTATASAESLTEECTGDTTCEADANSLAAAGFCLGVDGANVACKADAHTEATVSNCEEGVADGCFANADGIALAGFCFGAGELGSASCTADATGTAVVSNCVNPDGGIYCEADADALAIAGFCSIAVNCDADALASAEVEDCSGFTICVAEADADAFAIGCDFGSTCKALADADADAGDCSEEQADGCFSNADADRSRSTATLALTARRRQLPNRTRKNAAAPRFSALQRPTRRL